MIRTIGVSVHAKRSVKIRSDGRTMDDVDIETQAGRHYTRLRRRYWRFFLGFLAWLVVLGTPLFAFGSRLDPVVSNVLFVLLVLGFLVCWTGSLVAWSSLIRFCCPRCGKRFILSWTSSWPTSTCKHCGLSLG